MNNIIIKLRNQLAQWTLQIKIDRKQAEKEGSAAGQDLGTAMADSVQKAMDKKTSGTNFTRGIKNLTASIKKQFSQAMNVLGQSLSLHSAMTLLISKAKAAVSELKEADTLLTKISKTNNELSKSELKSIGSGSFDIAGKYGKKATDYLASVKEASNARYKNAADIAELSIAAQAAGDMSAELANQMIFAIDKAYKMDGSILKLTTALDGMNQIASHNAVSMSELSEGMSIVSSTAASLNVTSNEAAAALGTIMASTQQSASEAAMAFQSILLNISQISNINLHSPMEVLEDLSSKYNKPDNTEVQKANLLNSISGGQNTVQLDALLNQWSTYEAMLQQYKDGAGSIAKGAKKTADSWEGSLNRLSNTWSNTIGTITDSKAIVSAINGLNSFLSVIGKTTDKLTPLTTIGLGAGLFASFKNIGKCRMSVRISALF